MQTLVGARGYAHEGKGREGNRKGAVPSGSEGLDEELEKGGAARPVVAVLDFHWRGSRWTHPVVAAARK